MKKLVFLFIAIVFLSAGCTYLDIYKEFQPNEELRGETKIISHLPDGNYVVTPGYMRRFYKICLSEARANLSEKGARAYARNMVLRPEYTILQYPDKTWLVKPKLVEEVENKTRNIRRGG
jgi:hypothetical protein